MECCEKKDSKKSAYKSGILYGLIPHAGCIAFIAFSLLGVASATFLFRNLLLNPYFFYILIGLSMIFSTISFLFYLKRKNILCSCKNEKGREVNVSLTGIKNEWKYATTLYGTTILVNLLLFMVVFPLTTNLSIASPNSQTAGNSILTLQVAIPCSGHAPLITDELKKINGVSAVKFNFPNYFDVRYDATKVTKDKILSLDVFSTYKATVVNENSVSSSSNGLNTQDSNSRTSSCGCGCGGGCAVNKIT